MIIKEQNNININKGLTYEEYKQQFIEKVTLTDVTLLNEKEKILFEYTKLNLHRSNRIEKTYTVSEELQTILKNIKEKQSWMIITENWCGDSAQTLPYIAKMAEINPLIELNVILRDSNLDIIDNYLTNGTRSIPKLIVFDSSGNELFLWGPRPEDAQRLVLKLKNEEIHKEEINQKLHLWYGKDRGKNIEKEFMKILNEKVGL